MSGNEPLKGWLAIPGVQRGERTLAEQMMGLEPALAECAGKTVIDFGCAEGLIGIEFAKHRAHVLGFELQDRFVKTANEQAQLAGIASRCGFVGYDLAGFVNPEVPEDFKVFWKGQADIVLALAIVHKLPDPGTALANMASLARQRLVLRLPIGSTGVIPYKQNRSVSCDSRQILPAAGMRLEQVCDGPRGELVQHWVR
jgi:ribosomal protein L11 methylase PrmA